MPCFEATVEGRVQGVGYRMFTVRKAADLGLQGWVRNRPDGRVEVVAQGQEELLKNLVLELRQGPPSGRVDDLRLRWLEEDPSLGPFSVRY